ncbi:PQQ-binding-like beta-propeller repeat protein [Halomicrobium sp. IBSBa]|uniref:outer membrane protein assembly factor BamB family protein n=1 Tax=Halomicrobium sp. IBSBa TaxID=2778916 RepID=UPI001ABFF18D|nr:PQQ-binding-like beta-propeller repeat protein [Halomicrobium sp. IBSBa]MBO4248570.1 PQQ-binding-like beta-propeller repeat protein [Halomicrobium sp. IBSBa]
MSDRPEPQSVGLGDPPPARSRHAGRRSAVALTGELVVVGTATGDVIAFDHATLTEQWRADGEESDAAVVALAAFGDAVLAGERGPDGRVRCYEAATGRRRWQHATATEIGEPQRETRFFLPFVADIVTDEDRAYVAARRYERDGDRRSFRSVVSAFADDGTRRWQFEADASPISLDRRDDRLAVAYNRCPGDHQQGLVVLDAERGTSHWQWDPGGDGQRRVGDAALVEDGAVVASHGDYCGYRLDDGGTVRWRAELATRTTVGDETLYAYPNHVAAGSEAAVFVTGNTYAVDSRETDALHPAEHTAFGYGPDGQRRWSADVGGFAGEIAVTDRHVVVPGAQHFRTRDVDCHGLRVLSARDGPVASRETDGIVTAVAVDGDRVVAVEEPVVYHDDGTERGAYRLFVDRAARSQSASSPQRR